MSLFKSYNVCYWGKESSNLFSRVSYIQIFSSFTSTYDLLNIGPFHKNNALFKKIVAENVSVTNKTRLDTKFTFHQNNRNLKKRNTLKVNK